MLYDNSQTDASSQLQLDLLETVREKLDEDRRGKVVETFQSQVVAGYVETH
jgi:hypothetical protein